MGCKNKHHECHKKYSEDWCCKNCNEYQQEQCIEYDYICDVLWDYGCSLEEEVYFASIPDANSYIEHLNENKPHCIENSK